MGPKIVIILGTSGSGKGTQAKLVQEKLGLGYVGSGDLLRTRSAVDDFSGRKLKKVMNGGGFAPSAVIFKLWIDKWEDIKNIPEFSGFIIDGSPRKLLEAMLIDQSLEWYEWRDVKVVFVDVSREEAFSRLSKRMREDDTPEAINSRLDLFEKEVMPVVKYYEKLNRLIRIKGEQGIESVHKDIMKAIA